MRALDPRGSTVKSGGPVDRGVRTKTALVVKIGPQQETQDTHTARAGPWRPSALTRCCCRLLLLCRPPARLPPLLYPPACLLCLPACLICRPPACLICRAEAMASTFSHPRKIDHDLPLQCWSAPAPRQWPARPPNAGRPTSTSRSGTGPLAHRVPSASPPLLPSRPRRSRFRRDLSRRDTQSTSS